MSQRKATLLVNPAARGVKASFDPARAARYLATHGIETQVVVPESAAGATDAAREAAARADDLLFAIGGDGTMRDVALGLAGSKTALAAVPSGTVNIWAREAGIPKGVRKSLDVHIAGQTAAMDLGRADGACFLLMAGIGWDAEITATVSSRLKKLTGDLAYIARGVQAAPGLRSKPATWQIGSERLKEELAWMVLGNSRLYGGRIHLTKDAVVNDGLLDGIAFLPRNLGETLRLAGKVVAGKREDPRLSTFRTSELRLETPGLAVQLDGDYFGETPMKFTVEPAALRVSLPAGRLPEIFAERPMANG
jgi:YegS/Rv2252/BmrU family lipid kinase